MIVAVLTFGFLGALIALVSDPSGLMKGNTDRLNLALTIPVLAPVLGLVHRERLATPVVGAWGRLHYRVVTAATLLLTAMVAYWNLIGCRY